MSLGIHSGTVTKVLYENEDFRILLFSLDSDDKSATKGLPVTVKGDFPAQNVQIGTWLSFEAKWVDNEQYGKQLLVTRSPVAVARWTDDKALAVLSSNGVGPNVRMRLQEFAVAQGMPLCDVLDTKGLSIPGVDQIALEHAQARWRSIRTYMDATEFMSEAGIPASVVSSVWKTFGSDIESLITSDPWILLQVPGITFSEVDEIAIRLNVPLSNSGRVRGAVISAIQSATQDGHVFLSTSQTVSAVNELIGETPAKDIAAAIAELTKSKKIVVDKSVPDTVALYDTWYHHIEVLCAEMLAARVATPLEDAFLRKAICGVGDRVRTAYDAGAPLTELAVLSLENWAAGHRTSLTDDQLNAATKALTSQVSLLTGLPGTGKTTTLRAVVSILKDMNVPFLLTSPTGIAAKRMTSVTGSEASTIHRVLGAKGSSKAEEEREASYIGIIGDRSRKTSSNEGSFWEYCLDNPHPAKYVVVDESSMLDLHMLYRLLTATSSTCRLMFVGDPYQLPSVGAGDVLHDMVRSKAFPHSHLATIFRQEGTSGIVMAAHAVHAGQTPDTTGADFVLMQAASEEEASDIITKIASNLYGKRKNFQVLSPRHAGSAGVTALNQKLRMSLNPSVAGLAEMRLGGSVVREGDRIMVVKNDYDLGVYNGDVGKVSRIDRRTKEVQLKIFEGPDLPSRVVSYLFKDATRAIRLAYAQTVHKSQGQEYDFIVLPILMSFGQQLQRNLFYTAITRAKKKVFLVGSIDAIRKAVLNNQAERRNTRLDTRLTSLICTSNTTP